MHAWCLLGEHGLDADGKGSAREYGARVEWLRREESTAPSALREQWWHGAADFVEKLAERVGRRGAAGECASERGETDEQLARHLWREGLRAAGLDERDLGALPKSDPRKVCIARELRTQTPMTRAWIAARLRMGSASYVSSLLGGQKCQ